MTNYPDYIVIETYTLEQLEDRVRELYNMGYRPVGGVCHNLPTNQQNGLYLQAMERRGEVNWALVEEDNLENP